MAYSCDYCRKEIRDGDERMEICAYGQSAGEFESWKVHYHGDCYQAVLDELLAEVDAEEAAVLERIPTASGQKIAALRRRHNREAS